MVPHHTNTITFVDLDGVVPHHHLNADGVVFDQNFKFKMVLVFCTNTIYHGGWCFARDGVGVLHQHHHTIFRFFMKYHTEIYSKRRDAYKKFEQQLNFLRANLK